MQLTLHLTVSDARAFIEFTKRAFGAQEITRHQDPTGNRIMHAEITIGDTRVMLHDEYPGMELYSAKSIGKTPLVLNLDVPDADAAFQSAVEAGAAAVQPVADQFWGARYGQVKDPFGNVWAVNQQTEQLSLAEREQRAAKAMQG